MFMVTYIMRNYGSDTNIQAEHIYKQIHAVLSESEDSSIMLAHSGRFSQDLVNSICEGIENMMLDAQVKKTLVKRMFSILIEGLQNLRIHGREDSSGNKFGHIIVAKNSNEYTVSFGSYANTEDKKFLSVHIDGLNNKSPEEIKAYYLEKLSNGFLSEKGGAGLGFITIAMKSKAKIDYAFHETEFENLLYFTVQASLNFLRD